MHTRQDDASSSRNMTGGRDAAKTKKWTCPGATVRGGDAGRLSRALV